MNVRKIFKKLVMLSATVTALSMTTLTVAAGSDKIAAADYEILEDAIDAYFDVRECEFYDGYGVMTLGLEEVSDEDSPIVADETNRKQAIEELEERTGIRILDANVETAILSSAKIEEIQTLNSAITYSRAAEEKEYYYMQVYEWTWINYDYSKAGTEDVMGYSTVHEIVLEKDGDTATIVSDGYEDGLLLDVASADYAVDYSSMVSDAAVYDVDLASVRSADNYNVNLAIEYADTYVIHNYISGGDKDYYNSYYKEYADGEVDCCNFVSQCLSAGGLEETAGWHSEHWDGTNRSTASWTSVSALVSYLKGKGYEREDATNSSVFPGNPVYVSGHIGICVGYNAAGVPILNAHTNDAYHIPLDAWNSSSLSTIQISTSNLQINKPADAVDFGTVTSAVVSGYFDGLSEQEADYYCFEVSKEGFYEIYTTGEIDTVGYLFEESCDVEFRNTTLYMYEVAREDDDGDDRNFHIYEYLTPGIKYYVKVVSFDGNVSGDYNIYVESVW